MESLGWELVKEKVDKINNIDDRFYLSLFIHLTPRDNNLWTKLKIINRSDYFSRDVENCVFLCHNKLIIVFLSRNNVEKLFYIFEGDGGFECFKNKIISQQKNNCTFLITQNRSRISTSKLTSIICRLTNKYFGQRIKPNMLKNFNKKMNKNKLKPEIRLF